MLQAWSDWLSTQDWDWFLTVTFREPLPAHRQEGAVNAVGALLRRSFMPERLFLGAEPHLSTSMHLHGLYKSSGNDLVKRFEPTAMWRALYKTFGRSRIESPRGALAVNTYVAKYCVKDQGYHQMWGPEDKLGKCEVQGVDRVLTSHGGVVLTPDGWKCVTCGHKVPEPAEYEAQPGLI